MEKITLRLLLNIQTSEIKPTTNYIMNDNDGHQNFESNTPKPLVQNLGETDSLTTVKVNSTHEKLPSLEKQPVTDTNGTSSICTFS